MEIVSVILLIVVIGLIVAFVLRSRAEGGRAPELEREQERLAHEVAETKHQLDRAQQELRTVREEAATLRADRSNQTKRIEELTGERDQARSDLKTAQAGLGQTRERLAELEAAHDTREQELEQRRTELETRFQAIAANVSESTREQFIKEFRDLTEQQSDQSQEAVTNLLKPVRERLAELQRYVDESDQRRASDYAKVSGGVERLLEETSGLRRILHNPSRRGEWGEQHLHNVMQAAGMTDHVDFVEQEVFSSEGSTARPDVVVHIPGGVQVVVVAKTPFASYDAAMRSENEDERARLFADHARSLLGHAQTLESRDYTRWVKGSPDFVVMYVPTDPMLDAAIDANSGVWQEAWERHRVLIATPGLLIAFLRTVALAWQQQAIQQNAQDIADSARELYDRLGTYTGHILRMGNQLGNVVDTYNKSVGSFQTRVLPQARRIESLSKIEPSARIGEPEPVVKEPRELRAPEVHELPGNLEAAD